MSELLETPLAAWHRAHGAKMAPFAGWDMPIQYEGILVEHNHTRAVASVFDICHMGQFVVRGEGAARLLALAVTHNLDSLKPGKCRYGFLLNPQSGVLDDLIIYRMGDDHFFLVVNATGSGAGPVRSRTGYGAYPGRVRHGRHARQRGPLCGARAR